jgi:dienelactone hydrolase
MIKKNMRVIVLFLMIAGLMFFAACSGAPPAEMNEENQKSSEEKAPEIAPETDESVSSIESEAAALSSEPQKMKFITSDGIELNGVYYPAGSISAPLVILMHWAPGDQEDWVEIAYWLQNRGLGGNSKSTENTPWLDSSWFPGIEPEKSYNVFSFTFRNCENGCKSFERDKWYVDVQAAVEYAYKLDGINKDNIIMIGASIGSDGAADGCAYLNQVHTGSCKGALSFSPGNYLTVSFSEMVRELGAASNPVPVWCLYAESDPESAGVCGNISEDNYTPYPYSSEMIFSNGHGMNLIAPNHDPDPLELMLKFLALVS